VGTYRLASLAPDLLAMAEGLRALAAAKAVDLVTEPAIDAVRESNADIFATRGGAIGAMWGSYARKYSHPLPKDVRIRYWLIDEDYFDQMHLRTSLTQVGRHPRSRLQYTGMEARWWSTLPYASYVNRRYGTIYGLTRRGKDAVLEAVANQAREIADLSVRGSK
jgi:hypothetical protein